MAVSQTSGLPLAVQISRAKVSLLDGLDLLDAIRSPEALHQESVARANSRLDDVLLLVRESQDPGTYRAEILQCAAKLQSLHQESEKAYAQAQEVHKGEAQNVLRRVAHKLIEAIGSDLVKEVLDGVVHDNSEQPRIENFEDIEGTENTESGETTRCTKRRRMFSNADGLQQCGESGLTGAFDWARKRLDELAAGCSETDAHAPTTRAAETSVQICNEQNDDAEGHIMQEDAESLEQMAVEPENAAVINGKQLAAPVARKLRKSKKAFVEHTSGNSSRSLSLLGEDNSGSPGTTELTASPSPRTSQPLCAGGEHSFAGNNVLLTFVDASENVVGSIERVSPWSAQVGKILQIPVLRKPKIKENARFTQADIVKVCDPADSKGTRLLACMIQAGGCVMVTTCTWCKKNWGPFKDCIRLEDGTFSKCGNCEWTHHGCRGASAVSGAQQVGGMIDKQANADGGSCANVSDNDDNWNIYQIKTADFTSAPSGEQCWRFQNATFEYLRDSKPSRNFDVKLHDIAQIRWSAKSWRVQIKLKNETGPGDGIVMVTLEDESTVKRFVEFCKSQSLATCPEEAP